jgi:polar amino acid transport system substrate-binding protein
MKAASLALFVSVIALGVAAWAVQYPVATGASAAPKETTYERILRTGEIHCGYSVWHPLFFIDVTTNEKKGIFHDLMEETAKRLQLKIVWQEELGWGTALESVKNGRVNMACAGYWLHPDRIKHVSFTTPLFYAAINAWVRANDTRPFTRLEDLNSDRLTVGQIDGGATQYAVARRFPKAKQFNLPELTTNADLIESLTTGKIDFIVEDPTSFRDYIVHNPGKVRRLFSEEPVAIFPVVMLLPPNDLRLKEVLDGVLRNMEYDGTLDDILKNYQMDGAFLRNAKPKLETR